MISDTRKEKRKMHAEVAYSNYDVYLPEEIESHEAVGLHNLSIICSNLKAVQSGV